MTKDTLYHLFEQHLHDESLAFTKAEELTLYVAQKYCDYLQTLGHIPFLMKNVVEEDICYEILEMYRKKTYGFLNLSDYREFQLRKKR